MYYTYSFPLLSLIDGGRCIPYSVILAVTAFLLLNLLLISLAAIFLSDVNEIQSDFVMSLVPNVVLCVVSQSSFYF